MQGSEPGFLFMNQIVLNLAVGAPGCGFYREEHEDHEGRGEG
jgi:hypothetical protein